VRLLQLHLHGLAGLQFGLHIPNLVKDPPHLLLLGGFRSLPLRLQPLQLLLRRRQLLPQRRVAHGEPVVLHRQLLRLHALCSELLLQDLRRRQHVVGERPGPMPRRRQVHPRHVRVTDLPVHHPMRRGNWTLTGPGPGAGERPVVVRGHAGGRLDAGHHRVQWNPQIVWKTNSAQTPRAPPILLWRQLGLNARDGEDEPNRTMDGRKGWAGSQ